MNVLPFKLMLNKIDQILQEDSELADHDFPGIAS